MNDKNIIAVETIERYRKEQGISRRGLAIAVGIPPSTLQATFDKTRKLSLENTIKIAAYLKIPMSQFLKAQIKPIEENLVEKHLPRYIQIAQQHEKFQLELMKLTGLTSEQLIERLMQGWQLTPPNRDELDALFEGMAKLGTEEANIHPDGDEHILACPRCGSGEYLHNEDGNQNDYCGQCGQKLEWGEEDEI